MPPDVLYRVVEIASPKLVKSASTVCRQWDPADSCFFPVSGTFVVDVPGQDKPIRIAPGQIIGEFSLWIPNIPRTATVRAIDDGLLLAFHTSLFQQVMNEESRVAQGIYNIIKGRIIENVLNSKRLFPLEQKLSEGGNRAVPVSCEKYGVGTRLELASSAFIVFNGRVSITPPEGGELIVTATGNFGTEQVVGIVSDIGSPDGSEATVLEETVAIKLSHSALRQLQGTDPVGNAWSALCGERLRAIRRLQTSPKNGGVPTGGRKLT